MRFILILLALSQCSFGWSLNRSDFYENGQLIEVKDPPYFVYNQSYCVHHILNWPKKTQYKGSPYLFLSHPYRYIYDSSKQSLVKALEVCFQYLVLPPPFYWPDGCKANWRDEWMKHFIFHFFQRYPPNFREPKGWPCYNDALEYSEYVLKYEYLYYWFDFLYNIIDRNLKRRIQEKEEIIKEYEEKKYSRYNIKEIREDIEKLTQEIKEIPYCRQNSIACLTEFFEKIPDLFFLIYEDCIEQHKNPTAIYQRGRIYFDRGDTAAFISDIFDFIQLGHTPTPEMNLDLGKAYNDANLYNHAIKVLSEALQKNPELKEAYFERAVAYFETGNLQLALADYLNYGTKPTFLKDRNYQHFVFSMGVGLGCAKGGLDSAIHFVPSLFSTIYGLGKGLWTLAADPLGVSKELVEEAIQCIDYLRNNLTPELLASLVPELKECIQKWDQLEEEKKGYSVGYVIGHYGVDALICGGSARAIQLYRNLKKANEILTLETALASSANSEALAKASEDFFTWRNNYKKKCTLHFGQQEKHIPGANNFQSGKGELTIPVERLEKLVTSKIGEGVPTRFSFGEAGYKELVEFDEIIGIHVEFKTEARYPTRIGEIHYDKNGGYHVVPVEPNKLQRLLGKKK